MGYFGKIFKLLYFNIKIYNEYIFIFVKYNFTIMK